MDKGTAIKESYRKRQEQSENNFQTEVENLVFEIEETSNKLRDLKARLAKLEYKEPEIQGEILIPL